jgi:hypothetical protein
MKFFPKQSVCKPFAMKNQFRLSIEARVEKRKCSFGLDF